MACVLVGWQGRQGLSLFLPVPSQFFLASSQSPLAGLNWRPIRVCLRRGCPCLKAYTVPMYVLPVDFASTYK